MKPMKTKSLLADLLIERIGAEVLDDTLAREISRAFAEALAGFQVTRENQAGFGLDTDDPGQMWGGVTRH